MSLADKIKAQKSALAARAQLSKNDSKQEQDAQQPYYNTGRPLDQKFTAPRQQQQYQQEQPQQYQPVTQKFNSMQISSSNQSRSNNFESSEDENEEFSAPIQQSKALQAPPPQPQPQRMYMAPGISSSGGHSESSPPQNHGISAGMLSDFKFNSRPSLESVDDIAKEKAKSSGNKGLDFEKMKTNALEIQGRIALGQTILKELKSKSSAVAAPPAAAPTPSAAVI